MVGGGRVGLFMSERPGQPADRTGGVSLRAIVLALALLVVLAPVMFFVETAWLAASGGVGGAIAPGAVLFLLTGLMGLPIFRRTGLTRRELLTVYCVVCVAFVLYQYTVFFYIVPKVPLYYHMARTNTASGSPRASCSSRTTATSSSIMAVSSTGIPCSRSWCTSRSWWPTLRDAPPRS